LPNLFPCCAAGVFDWDSLGSWAFNDGIYKAQFSALRGWATVSHPFLRLNGSQTLPFCGDNQK
jgi:hypothetical protein